MLRMKPEVRLALLKPQTLLGIFVVENAFRQLGKDCLITSVNDGGHMEGSKHYTGYAFDFRTKSLPDLATKNALIANIKASLPEAEYDVLLEYPGGYNEHGHCEYDPNG